ncbi:MAG: hypothetical protein IIW56_00985 [Oscillospiraceae bacterium]|nr:hypothetical protein [Oscillospiraceae bacterium]
MIDLKLSEVKQLLDDHGIAYLLTIEPSRREFYVRKGFCPREDSGAFRLLSIKNPHHTKNIDLIFVDASEDPEFYDLEFGGYPYELFGWLDEELPREIWEDIQSILTGRIWVIFATDAKTGKWFGDSLYRDSTDEDENDMDRLQKALAKIKKPKRLWRKLIGRTDCYEVFNWTNYEKIIK